MNNFLLLFYAFIKVGILGYGGGHSIIPFIQVEAVENYKWISMEEFNDTLAMANTLPGPIAVKMSFMVGYKTAGLSGALICLLGLLLPSLLLMLALASLYLRYKDLPAVEALLKGVRPVVFALLVLVTYKIWPSSIVSWPTAAIAAVSLCLMGFFNLHPAILMVVGAALGFMLWGRS
jgi:chromate transporter